MVSPRDGKTLQKAENLSTIEAAAKSSYRVEERFPANAHSQMKDEETRDREMKPRITVITYNGPKLGECDVRRDQGQSSGYGVYEMHRVPLSDGVGTSTVAKCPKADFSGEQPAKNGHCSVSNPLFGTCPFITTARKVVLDLPN